MSSVLYYSKFCNHCKELITRIAKTKTKNEMHFVCIDNREKHTDGTTNIILENGQRLLLPPNVKTVPSILLLHHGNRVLGGIKEILHYLKPGEETIMNQATNTTDQNILGIIVFIVTLVVGLKGISGVLQILH